MFLRIVPRVTLVKEADMQALFEKINEALKEMSEHFRNVYYFIRQEFIMRNVEALNSGGSRPFIIFGSIYLLRMIRGEVFSIRMTFTKLTQMLIALMRWPVSVWHR